MFLETLLIILLVIAGVVYIAFNIYTFREEGGFSWTVQGFLTGALGLVVVLILMVYAWLVSIRWIVNSINGQSLAPVNFFVFWGLLIMLTGILRPSIYSRSYTNIVTVLNQ
jgi:hypothetical protein